MAYLEFQKGNRSNELGIQKLPYKEHWSSQKQEKEVSKGFMSQLSAAYLLNVSF